MTGQGILGLAQMILWSSFVVFLVSTVILVALTDAEPRSERWGWFWQRFGIATLLYLPFVLAGLILTSVAASILSK